MPAGLSPLCMLAAGAHLLWQVQAARHRRSRQLPDAVPRQPRDRRIDRAGLPAGELVRLMPLSILTAHGLLLFIGAELIFSLTPGPTVMMISAYGVRRAAFATRWPPSPAPRPAIRCGMRSASPGLGALIDGLAPAFAGHPAIWAPPIWCGWAPAPSGKAFAQRQTNTAPD